MGTGPLGDARTAGKAWPGHTPPGKGLAGRGWWGLTGIERLDAILEVRERIATSVVRWKELGERPRERIRAWDMATALHRHAHGELSAVANEVGGQLDAIRNQRTLLNNTDNVGPSVTRLSDVIGGALAKLHERLTAAVEAATARLAADATWRNLSASDPNEILREFGLTLPRELCVGTNEAPDTELDSRRLAAWRAEIDAVPTRKAKALAEVGRHTGGGRDVVKRVREKRGTLGDAEAVRRWLAEHQQRLMKAVRDGAVIVE